MLSTEYVIDRCMAALVYAYDGGASSRPSFSQPVLPAVFMLSTQDVIDRCGAASGGASSKCCQLYVLHQSVCLVQPEAGPSTMLYVLHKLLLCCACRAVLNQLLGNAV
jgi:hypothetical protein